jgi:hypothetical protein
VRVVHPWHVAVQGLAEGSHVEWEVELLDFERQVGPGPLLGSNICEH